MLSQKLLNRVCHGWAFRVHTEQETKAIKHYLETGEIQESFPYKAVDQAAKEGRIGK